jgi:hypothetical protein
MTVMLSGRYSYRSNLWSRIQVPSIAIGSSTALALLSSDFYFHGMVVASLMTIATLPFAFPIASINVYRDVEKRWNRMGLRRWLTFGSFIGLCSVGVLTIVLTTIHPEVANAQFFKNAETWMKGKFTGADKAIEIVFNVLRGLFLIYLGISLVKTIQAARQDQDWQDLARTPLIIVIAVVLGDVLSTFIVGGA